jgi:hypothetical protein
LCIPDTEKGGEPVRGRRRALLPHLP